MADTEVKPIDLRGRRLMVAIPAYDGKLNLKTAFALARLSAMVGHYGIHLELSQVSGCSLITKARNSLVTDFMLSDCTDLLFIDADVIVQPEQIIRLLALSTDKDITAAMYPRRGIDCKFFVDLYADENNQIEMDNNGMLRVRRVGTGFMLIRRHVLETMIAKHPEWKFWNNARDIHEHAVFDFQLKDGEYFGEDYLFCDRAAEDGFTVFIDPTISLPHIGTHEFQRNFEEDAFKPMLEAARKVQLKVVNG